ncbi:DsbA family protein [Patescibacteria group bacterium]|nr:MAG: DsbA family protein [Patescibacteria group bacterium]
MPSPAQPWYERPAPVFALLTALAFAGFLFLVIWYGAGYYRAMKSGKNVALPQFRSSFTAGSLSALKPAAKLYDVASPDAPLLGNPYAKITIVVFGDFECPYTKEAHPTFRGIAAEYPNDVRLLWRDFPLETIHPRARPAAVAASCAGRQDKYWAMHDKLFANQNALEEKDFLNYAEQIGLNTAEFTACLKSGGDKERIDRDLAAGTAATVRGTPTFFINGQRVEGAIPYEILKQIVEKFKAAK